MDGDPAPVANTGTLFDGTILFLHEVTGELPVRVDVSLASNHNWHPVTDLGSNPEILCEFAAGGGIYFKIKYYFVKAYESLIFLLHFI
jgi:hypothetical protein